MSRRNLTLAAVLLLMIAPLVLPEFYVTLLNYTGLASIVALGLVLLTGVAGQMSFGQAAFVGIGAYTTAVLTTRYDMSPWLSLPAAIALTAVIALFLGFIPLRLSGHYLPLGTIAWGIAIYFLLGNLEWLGKYSGIAEIPPLTLLGVRFGDGRTFYYLIWAVTLVNLPQPSVIRSFASICSDLKFKAERDYESSVKFFGIVSSMIAQALNVQRLVEEERRRLVDENTHLRQELRDQFPRLRRRRRIHRQPP